MEVTLTKKDIEDVINFMEHEGLVSHMNDAGLSYAAMGFVLTVLSNECKEVLRKMGVEE